MPHNDRLITLLSALDDDELRPIWVDALRSDSDDHEYVAGTKQGRVRCISKEWRAVHGHTLRNRFRKDHELPWKRILIDVADKLHPWQYPFWTSFKMSDRHTEAEIEAVILRMHDDRIRQAWGKLTPAKQEELAQTLNAEFNATAAALGRTAQGAAARNITVTSLGSGIAAGLLTGAGALALAQGSASLVVGGLFGGALYQLGLWLVVRLFGVWSGAQLVAGGGAAAIGGALLSVPAAAVFVANALMTTSYRKTIPATLLLLSAHELRRQFADLKV